MKYIDFIQELVNKCTHAHAFAATKRQHKINLNLTISFYFALVEMHGKKQKPILRGNSILSSSFPFLYYVFLKSFLCFLMANEIKKSIT